MSEDRDLTIVEHLSELRMRLIRSLLFTLFVTIICYGISDKIMARVQSVIAPALPNGKLIFITPIESFMVSIKFSFFIGILVSLPYILFQFWSFVYIALDRVEKRYFNTFLFFSLLSFYLGGGFSYFIVLPFAIKFLVTGTIFTPMISVDGYYTFLIYSTLTFGMIFQTPLAILTMCKLKILTPEFLKKSRRYMILIVFILGAIFSPPDIFSQFLVAIPMLFLFELGIFLCKIF
jgi:sec-independent protein translocase protein TatC